MPKLIKNPKIATSSLKNPAIIIMPIILNHIRPPNNDHIDRLIRGGQFLAADRLNLWNQKHPRSILSISCILFISLTLIHLKLE